MSSPGPRGGRATRRVQRRRRLTGAVAAVALLALLAGGALALTQPGGDDAGATKAPRVAADPTPASPTSTVAGLPCRSALTPGDPLRVWIAGDSIAYSVGNGLGKKLAGTGVVAAVYESRVASGLSSPGFFDWPGRVAQELPRLSPEVVVFVMGTNDWSVPQATPVDASGQPAWKATYRAKAQAMVDTLTAGGGTLYWVGPPVLRDPRLEAGARDVAAVIRSVVDAAPSAEYFDLHDLLDTADGSYTATVDDDGTRVLARAGDGVHLTPEGATFVGDALFTRLDASCRLRAQAVPGRPQSLVETRGSTSAGSGPAPTETTDGPTVPATTPDTTATTAATVPPTVAPTTPPTTTGTPGPGPGPAGTAAR
ncbi:MAG: DUF459 domain-containing protein [Actinomycetota bacterium]